MLTRVRKERVGNEQWPQTVRGRSGCSLSEIRVFELDTYMCTAIDE